MRKAFIVHLGLSILHLSFFLFLLILFVIIGDELFFPLVVRQTAIYRDRLACIRVPGGPFFAGRQYRVIDIRDRRCPAIRVEWRGRKPDFVVRHIEYLPVQIGTNIACPVVQCSQYLILGNAQRLVALPDPFRCEIGSFCG